MNADQIIVLKAGRISETGPLNELMKSDGYYASLVKQQTNGLLQNAGETLEIRASRRAQNLVDEPELFHRAG